MNEFRGRVVAITGAASGIGAALARAFAAEGADVALSDVDADGLAETEIACKQLGYRVTTALVDVADRDAVFAWADEVERTLGRVNVIVNNAGVALIADVANMAHDDLRWVMDIDFWGVVHGTEAFLPKLEAAGEGHVVNISSVFGLMSIPGQAAYNAAKFAVRGYTDALRMELEIAGSPISATTVHPGGIKTAIVRNARHAITVDGPSSDEIESDFEAAARTTPDEAAAQILRAVRRNRRRALIGPDAPVFDAVSRLPAALSQRLLVAGARRRR